MVVGLDAAPPILLYRSLRRNLPTLSQLIGDSCRFVLNSCHPPITIPAWLSMITGKTPGELGMYGFRHRKPGDYLDYYIVNYRSVKCPTLWDVLGSKGLRSIVVGVPPTYPPRPIRGVLVSCFITPNSKVDYTFPPQLKFEIEKLVEKLEREGTDARLIRKYLKRVKQRASAKRSMR